MSLEVEETLVLIKPDGVARGLTGEILRRIEAKGYQLVDLRFVHADRDLSHSITRSTRASPSTSPSSSSWRAAPSSPPAWPATV